MSSPLPQPYLVPARQDFRDLYVAWYARVFRWVRALGGPEADAEDLTQDVFLVVHRRLSEFDGANVAGWLYRITRRRVRDFRRALWFRLQSGEAIPTDIVAPGPDAEAQTTTQRELRSLERALEDLTTGERNSLLMLEWEGRSGEEIAQLENAALNTVWSRIRRARIKLRNSTNPPSMPETDDRAVRRTRKTAPVARSTVHGQGASGMR